MIDVLTPHGHTARFSVRPDTTDAMTVNACCTEDEYGLGGQPWSGVALDVGAHIGGVTVMLGLDQPDLRVVAVEALPENVEVLTRNVAANGLAERVTVVGGAATNASESVAIAYGTEADPFERMHRFIGGALWQDTPAARTVACPPISLSAIVAEYGPLALLKIDCEGCEWSFLDDPAVGEVAVIVGEYHPRAGYGPGRLRELLEATHVVDCDDALAFGPFRAVRR